MKIREILLKSFFSHYFPIFYLIKYEIFSNISLFIQVTILLLQKEI